MRKSQSHKSQHYVPRSYTSGWCDPAAPPQMTPYVWVFDRDARQGRRKAPVNLFEETDFYTIRKADGDRDLVLEHGLASLESRFVRIRQQLEERRRLNRADYVALVAFVAAMSSRTKAQREHQRAQWSKVRELMDLTMACWRKSTPEQRASLSRMTHLRGSSHVAKLSYDNVRSVADNPLEHLLRVQIRTMLPILLRMPAAVLETTDSLGFITSDNPVVIYDPESYKMPPIFRSPGLLSSTVEVTMPLSPRQLLAFAWQPISGFLPIPVRLVDGFNRRARFYTHEQFISNRNATRAIWFDPGEEPEDS